MTTIEPERECGCENPHWCVICLRDESAALLAELTTTRQQLAECREQLAALRERAKESIANMKRELSEVLTSNHASVVKAERDRDAARAEVERLKVGNCQCGSGIKARCYKCDNDTY